MINWNKLQEVLNDHYFCNSPDGKIYHLTDDMFTGFEINHDENIISFFNFYDCDFDNDDNYKNEQVWKFPIPTTVADFFDLIEKTNILYYDDRFPFEKTKQELITKIYKL